MSLADERCEVCRPGMPHISSDEARELADDIDPSWQLDSHTKITRRIKTGDFAEACVLAVRIGFLAEAEGHHPDLEVSWGRLTVHLTTHAAKGLTRNDFVLAAKIDRALDGS
jgi:4a-hydroxytetrahydrobiopterin dehydratase